MLDVMQRGILSLIHSAISGEPKPLPKGFDLSQAQKLIHKHKIGNMIYYGAVNCGLDKQQPVMKELFRNCCTYLYAEAWQIKQLQKVLDLFDQNGIDYMPLKGTLMKALYPKSDMRYMGDADVLIKLEQYDAIRPLLEQLGFEEKFESDHELIWFHPGLLLELHKRLIPSYNPEYYAYFGNGWRLAQPAVPGTTRYSMSREDQLIYQFVHFAKHYRDGGLGISHMTDLYLYRSVYKDLDEEYIAQEMKKLRLYDFYCNVCNTLSAWFEGAAHDHKTELITRYVFGSGLYGTEASHAVAQSLREVSQTGATVENSKRAAWLHLMLPGFQDMAENYPVLRKLPVLLPVMWVVRGVHALFFKRQVLVDQARKSRYVSEETVSSFEKALHEVGLTFRFEENEE